MSQWTQTLNVNKIIILLTSKHCIKFRQNEEHRSVSDPSSSPLCLSVLLLSACT